MEIKKMRCLVVDDEVVARRGIIRQLGKITSLEVVGEANCVEAFIEVNKKLKPDLIFLDIMLRNKNIMDYLSEVDCKPMIVFVTAFSNYALNGFELEAVDYLLKPVSDTRLHQCIARVNKLFRNNEPRSLEVSPNLFFKSNGKYYRTSPTDILFIKSMENYVLIYLESKKLVCKLTLEQIQKMLPQNLFLQVHRSFVVNVQKIDSIERLSIFIQNETIPISRDKRKDIYHNLMGMSLTYETQLFGAD